MMLADCINTHTIWITQFKLNLSLKAILILLSELAIIGHFD